MRHVLQQKWVQSWHCKEGHVTYDEICMKVLWIRYRSVYGRTSRATG